MDEAKNDAKKEKNEVKVSEGIRRDNLFDRF